MDKFMIDPPDNITMDQLRVDKIETDFQPEMGPPSSSVIKESFVSPSATTPETPSYEAPSSSVIKESYASSQPPSYEAPSSSVIKESLDSVSKALTPTIEIPAAPVVNPDVKAAFVESVSSPAPQYSWRTWLIWVLTLFVFIAFSIYFVGKYAINESAYVIKKNAGRFKVSFADIKADIESSVRDWNENLYDKINQFFFRQHVDNGVFKMTKYKIPKMLVPTGPEEKTAKQKPAK